MPNRTRTLAALAVVSAVALGSAACAFSVQAATPSSASERRDVAILRHDIEIAIRDATAKFTPRETQAEREAAIQAAIQAAISRSGFDAITANAALSEVRDGNPATAAAVAAVAAVVAPAAAQEAAAAASTGGGASGGSSGGASGGAAGGTGGGGGGGAGYIPPK